MNKLYVVREKGMQAQCVHYICMVMCTDLYFWQCQYIDAGMMHSVHNFWQSAFATGHNNFWALSQLQREPFGQT